MIVFIQRCDVYQKGSFKVSPSRAIGMIKTTCIKTKEAK
jgi:hypothetical protein